MIIELIKELPSEQAVLKLIAKFDKLLHKYANQARIEDSYEELRLFFIELLFQIKDRGICSENDGQVVNYINKALRNKSFQLNREGDNVNYILMSDMSDEQLIYVDQKMATEDYGTVAEFFSDSLSKREQQILYLIYEQGYSIAEIADLFKVSRQAINQAKKRAIEKIKKCYKII